MADLTFSKLSEDIVLKIFNQLEDDPRNWARLSCVCRKFSSLISTVCCKSKCISTFPSVSTDLLAPSSSSSSSPPGGWASLYKIAVCCPGLRHAGLLFDNSDFGLHRELGPDEDYVSSSSTSNSSNYSNSNNMSTCVGPRTHEGQTSATVDSHNTSTYSEPRVYEGQVSATLESSTPQESQTWTLYDDLYFDTVYDHSEAASTFTSEVTTTTSTTSALMDISDVGVVDNSGTKSVVSSESESKRRKVTPRLLRSHLASGVWSLSREQGNKLLASRFRDDYLYICDWPGCLHMEEKRNYMLFRGMFKNFKRSRVWRTINDGSSRSKIDVNCAFCSCKETWDLHSAFCLKRGFGFHDDGEPVVRAYVCENGHVSGAWTDMPLYT